MPVPPLFTQAAIDKATAALDGIVENAMKRTGMPGVAVGVVYKDKVIYAKGVGLRELGKPGAIDADTVFMLASVSKPIASTIVAKLVGDGTVKWDDPAKGHNPAFALNDAYVTEHATIADLMSHRSGLHTGAGDLLEDLGFDRDYILSHLDQQPLDPFRSTYHYSNFGYTAGGTAAGRVAEIAVVIGRAKRVERLLVEMGQDVVAVETEVLEQIAGAGVQAAAMGHQIGDRGVLGDVGIVQREGGIMPLRRVVPFDGAVADELGDDGRGDGL